MEKALNNKKECNHCIHYLAHYIKVKDQFRPILTGHCTNRKPSGHYRKTDNICECFTERDLAKEKEEQMQSATESLSFISQRISELTQILKILADKEKEQKMG